MVKTNLRPYILTVLSLCVFNVSLSLEKCWSHSKGNNDLFQNVCSISLEYNNCDFAYKLRESSLLLNSDNTVVTTTEQEQRPGKMLWTLSILLIVLSNEKGNACTCTKKRTNATFAH